MSKMQKEFCIGKISEIEKNAKELEEIYKDREEIKKTIELEKRDLITLYIRGYLGL